MIQAENSEKSVHNDNSNFFSGNLYACRLKNVLLCERKNFTARKISLAFQGGVRGKLYHSNETLDPLNENVSFELP